MRASADSGIPIASYTEAQLIIAEVQRPDSCQHHQHSSRARRVSRISGADPAQIAREVIEARRRELFLEGQRLFDIRRLNLPLVPAAGITYSVVYAKGSNYGSQGCMPIPNVETLNNPNA